MRAIHSWWHECGVVVTQDYCSNDPVLVTCKRCLAAMKKDPQGLKPVTSVSVPVSDWIVLVDYLQSCIPSCPCTGKCSECDEDNRIKTIIKKVQP